MRRFFVSLAAALAFAAVPSTALMATIERDNVCGGLNGTVSVGYRYNDQTNQMTALIVNNNSGGAATVIAQLIDPQTQAAVFTQANVINANQPQIVVNISSLNIPMVTVTSTRGTSLQPSVSVQCEIVVGR
jgi:hypothetical protein